MSLNRMLPMFMIEPLLFLRVSGVKKAKGALAQNHI